MSLDADIRRLEKKLNRISSKETPRAYAAAINKTAKMIQTEVAREVAKANRIRVKDVKRRVFIRKANIKKSNAKISVYAKPINAVSTNYKVTRRGYSVAGERVPRSFFAKGKSRRHQIFQRKGSARYPIDVVKIYINDDVQRLVMPIVERKMKTDFQRLLKHEFNARLRGYVKRAG